MTSIVCNRYQSILINECLLPPVLIKAHHHGNGPHHALPYQANGKSYQKNRAQSERAQKRAAKPNIIKKKSNKSEM